uniref:Uncharacterized protein n=1 Tax=Romanomermis culicivorax TaxID=13658 RepID=A0A915IHA2_ROMCU
MMAIATRTVNVATDFVAQFSPVKIASSMVSAISIIRLRCVAGYCRPKYSRNICFKDRKCPSGYNCDRSINKCSIIESSKTSDCTSSEQCEMGFKCRQGACLSFQLGKNCSGYDDQCRNANYECAESRCVLKNPRKTCRSSLDCDAGQHCKGRQCTPGNQEMVRKDAVSENATVMETTTVPNLKMRRSSGQQCDADLDCSIGQRCRTRTCLPTKQVLRCSNDSDCDIQYSCKDRECVLVDNAQGGSTDIQRSPKSCQNTKQCPSESKCLANRCRLYKQGKACQSDKECDNYYR